MTYQYVPETAADLFEELLRAKEWIPDYRRVYRALNQTFRKCLDLRTSDVPINLTGTFAKTDYLLKEHHAHPQLQRGVNDARVRLRHKDQLDERLLAENYPYDNKALCQFVSLVFRTPVPERLQKTFPEDRQASDTPLRISECMRLIVNRWDDTFIYGHTDEDSANEIQVCYAAGNQLYNYDWSYLQELLFPQCQLNLIRPQSRRGILYPELIILEPDYLVDISAIASCFDYAAPTPLVHLLNKLKPSAGTEPILLGNFAGQLLDEELHSGREEHSYPQSCKEFLNRNALAMLTAECSADFHSNARAQQQHIRQAIATELPRLLGRFDPREVVVEPSFFSEMLGLQGRMDFLQLDHRVLIEQKSGKGGYPQLRPDTPVHQKSHYIQMLLYMLLLRYNFRTQYEKNNRELNAFLLYSRYRNSLVGLGFAPELVFQAIKMRNGIVRQEFRLADGETALLRTLTPDRLQNPVPANNILWERYQKPQAEELLRPLREASELERAYYFRLFSFVEREHQLSKIGNGSKENPGFAAVWQSSLEEKLQTGDIYANLTLVFPTPADGGKISQVVFRFDERERHTLSNFRVGDVVFFYPYAPDSEPDARTTMVFRCFIKEIGSGQLTLGLRSTQADAHVFLLHRDERWAVEHDYMESSYGAIYKGMHSFLSAPGERRDLQLFQREPRFDHTRQLKGDYGTFNELVLRTKQAGDLFLIIGPPGTGKTSFGLMNTLTEELHEPDSAVLLLAYTHRAIDEICSKLTERHIDFIRLGSQLSCAEEYREYLLESRAWQCSRYAELKEAVMSARVMVATAATLSSNLALLRLKQFSLAIIDEASQILEPHLLGLLGAVGPHGKCAIRKFVMIGDHKQLPAVVLQRAEESRVSDPLLQSIGLTDCRNSLFERLLRRYRDDERVTYMLTRQGRMHPDIAAFCNTAFYHSTLQVVPCPHQTEELPAERPGSNLMERLLTARRTAFVAVPAPQSSPSDKVNPAEAEVIAAAAAAIYRLHQADFSPTDTVGIIVPYRSQIAAVRSAIERHELPPLQHITIDTVERYQGSQRDYIIYGFTVQHYYQLEFLTSNVFEEDGIFIDRKLNVALTRARKHLLLVGNPVLLSRNRTFDNLIRFVRQQRGYCTSEELNLP